MAQGKNVSTYLSEHELKAFYDFQINKDFKSESALIKAAVLSYINYKPPKKKK